jgi:hypothetical protein
LPSDEVSEEDALENAFEASEEPSPPSAAEEEREQPEVQPG